jgi:hypothetical protein
LYGAVPSIFSIAFFAVTTEEERSSTSAIEMIINSYRHTAHSNQQSA